ncbi:hypothetical protein AAMO2058_000259300 [Amorphochlora amoebiformis]
MSLTSEEVNFLVYRYLLESGFIHSAFAFGHESLITKSSIDGSKVIPGALISFIQKGLQFVEVETHVNEDGTETICDGTFSAIEPHKCNIKSKRRIFDPYAADSFEDNIFGSQEASSDEVMYLRGHSNIVCSCSWHPNQPVLASGSGDATVRIWRTSKLSRGNDEHVDKKAKTEDKLVVINIPAKKQEDSSQPSDSMVVSLKWNSSGSFLATGTYDGKVHTWTANGQRAQVLDRHRAPISAIKWSPSDDRVLTASFDKSVILWNASTGAVENTFAYHQGAITDIDWKDETTFAMCSIDRTISVCSTKSTSTPEAKLEGHAADINMIKWIGSSNLASCSDDSTIKIWNAKTKSCVQDFTQHTREVCAIDWANSGQLARFIYRTVFPGSISIA